MNQFVRILSIGLVVVAVGCGGSTPAVPTVPDNPCADKPPSKTQDMVFNYDEQPLEGMLFPAQAIGLPGMWKVAIPRRATLKKQRKIAAKASATVPQLQVLAGLAWNESTKLKKAKAPKDKVDALRTEARDALLRARKLGKDGGDEVTLKLLSVAQLTLGDEAAATEIYAELVKRFPVEGPNNAKIWLAHLYLNSNKQAEAAALVSGWTIDAKTKPMAAYVLAWTKFRARDYAGAIEAINHAALNWIGSSRTVVYSDAQLFLSRAGTPLADASAMLSKINAGDANVQYNWLYRLSNGYDLAGYTKLAVDTKELLLSGSVKAPLPSDEVGLRGEIAYLSLKLNQPAKTAELAIEAHKRLAACGEKCAKTGPQVLQAIQNYGTLFHTNYAHSLDEKFYAPAKSLYDYFVSLNTPDKDVVVGYITRLADTKANAAAGSGTLDQKELLKLLKLRFNLISACYEGVLQGDPTLAGSVKVTIEIKDDGTIRGVTTDPAKGKDGLSAVAGCVDERARAWEFPARTLPGVTAIVLPMSLKKK